VPRIGVTSHRGLPPHTPELIAAALRQELEPYSGNELAGVSCLAGETDQFFARTALDLGGTLQVVVPAEQCRDGLKPDEQRGYDQLFAKAKGVERLPFVEPTEQAHLAAGQAVVDHSERLVAVWDVKPARGMGGTADIAATPVRRACRSPCCGLKAPQGSRSGRGERITVEETYGSGSSVPADRAEGRSWVAWTSRSPPRSRRPR
jgi:hypothetical protein